MWSRLAGFTMRQLAEPIAERALVRLLLMRGTIHLVSARDAHLLRPLVQPVLDRGSASVATLPAELRPQILTAAAEHLRHTAATAVELAAVLAPRFPGVDPMAMATAARASLPLVQVTPRGLWGRTGPAAHLHLHSWAGEGTGEKLTVDGLVRRYLGAFGPATAADAQAWSGLTGLREVFERLDLWSAEVHGRVLYDLPDAPRPGPDEPAPARLLTDFDNLLLSHADRTRVIADDHRRVVITKNGIVHPTVLVDGRVAGTWRVERARGSAAVVVTPFGPLAKADREALAGEGLALLAATEPDKAHDVRV
ncbi:winged helix DNA-binding domain-containing protein [Actinokineospora guangxiensis]|uniref:Winged helix DNA-binding domain-containing protein n=1 Tax=Actinokineospora guangxiensis TaxID=1490288 RepID=A0ABW0EPW8_9PSEU